MDEHTKNVLASFLKEKKKEHLFHEKIQKIINGVLEKELKKHIHLRKVSKNRLIFSTEIASYAYEFNLKKKELLACIRKEFPQIAAIDIRSGW